MASQPSGLVSESTETEASCEPTTEKPCASHRARSSSKRMRSEKRRSQGLNELGAVCQWLRFWMVRAESGTRRVLPLESVLSHGRSWKNGQRMFRIGYIIDETLVWRSLGSLLSDPLLRFSTGNPVAEDRPE